MQQTPALTNQNTAVEAVVRCVKIIRVKLGTRDLETKSTQSDKYACCCAKKTCWPCVCKSTPVIALWRTEAPSYHVGVCFSSPPHFRCSRYTSSALRPHRSAGLCRRRGREHNRGTYTRQREEFSWSNDVHIKQSLQKTEVICTIQGLVRAVCVLGNAR